MTCYGPLIVISNCLFNLDGSGRLHFAGLSIVLWQLFSTNIPTSVDKEEAFCKGTRTATTFWKFLSRSRLHLVLVSDCPEDPGIIIQIRVIYLASRGNTARKVGR